MSGFFLVYVLSTLFCQFECFDLESFRDKIPACWHTGIENLNYAHAACVVLCFHGINVIIGYSEILIVFSIFLLDALGTSDTNA